MKRLIAIPILTLSFATGNLYSQNCDHLLLGQLKYQRVSTEQPQPNSIKLETSQGKRSLTELAKPPYLLHFWASWCHPCLDELRYLAAHIGNIEASGIAVISVSLDLNGMTSAKDTLSRLALLHSMPIYANPDNQLFRHTGGQILPATVLINRQGHISHRHDGIVDWGSPAYLQLSNCLRK